MEILIVWAIFAVIIVFNIKKAKKMQNERVQEHQQNMQNNRTRGDLSGHSSLSDSSLSHGANLNKGSNVDLQDAPYMVNSYGEKKYAEPHVQTYAGSQKMTSAETEKLKQEIRSRNNFQGKNAAPAMKTLDKAEFHSPVMQAGSTGAYSDMTGGHTFTQYECGHEYKDEIVPQNQTAGKGILDELRFDKNEMRKAFVMQEILKRKVI